MEYAFENTWKNSNTISNHIALGTTLLLNENPGSSAGSARPADAGGGNGRPTRGSRRSGRRTSSALASGVGMSSRDRRESSAVRSMMRSAIRWTMPSGLRCTRPSTSTQARAHHRAAEALEQRAARRTKLAMPVSSSMRDEHDALAVAGPLAHQHDAGRRARRAVARASCTCAAGEHALAREDRRAGTASGGPSATGAASGSRRRHARQRHGGQRHQRLLGEFGRAGRREQRQRDVVGQAAHLPGARRAGRAPSERSASASASRTSAALGRPARRCRLSRRRRRSRAARSTMRSRPVLAEAVDLAEAEPQRERAVRRAPPACCPSALALTSSVAHLDAVLPRIAHDLRRGIEAHRLAVEQRRSEDRGVVALQPGRDIDEQREGGGVAFGKAIFAEALDLLEAALGEVAS